MAIEIHSERLERLTPALVGRTGKSLSDVLSAALNVERDKPRRPKTWEELRAGIEAIQARIAALPVLDDRPAEEIIGYDENGLPQ